IFENMSGVKAAGIAGILTGGMTALGASCVLFMKTMNRKLFDVMLGLTGGVMLAARFFSLLIRTIDMRGGGRIAKVIPSLVGFALGSLFLYFLDKVVPHIHVHGDMENPEGPKTKMHGTKLLVLAITIHNIPEGLAVGVLFGGAFLETGATSLAAAIALAIGIGIQNFPE